MTRTIKTQPLTPTVFAPFGDVLDCAGEPDKMINRGLCARYHDRAALDFTDGRAGISLFKAQLRALPFALDLIERHPNGSQTFIPMGLDPFLVIAAENPDATPQAFLTDAGQAINFHKGTWHGVLTPLSGSGLFAVVDRVGPGANLEEHHFKTPWIIQA